MEINKLFGGVYADKRVFVTGHTGFKGSWLTFWLMKMEAKVTGFSVDYPSTPNHFQLINSKGIKSVRGDITDYVMLKKALKQAKPEIVFHLAAQALVRTSYENPLQTLQTNVIGTANLLDICKEIPSVKAIVIVTSDKCYAVDENNIKSGGYSEADPLGGNDPYSASKGCAEIITSAYRKSFYNLDEYGKSHNVLLASVRAGNVIGGGDWAKDRIISDIMRATSTGKAVTLRSPDAVRPWQHVLEPLSGYLLVGKQLLEGKKKFASSWNFGPRKSSNLTVKEMVVLCKKYWNAVDFNIEKNETFMRETKILTINSSKSRKELNWKPVWNGNNAVEKTVNWYKSFYETKKIITESDLLEYIDDAHKKLISWTK